MFTNFTSHVLSALDPNPNVVESKIVTACGQPPDENSVQDTYRQKGCEGFSQEIKREREREPGSVA